VQESLIKRQSDSLSLEDWADLTTKGLQDPLTDQEHMQRKKGSLGVLAFISTGEILEKDCK
jgi:hypothetical protein